MAVIMQDLRVEDVLSETAGEYLERIKVPGGWIYRQTYSRSDEKDDYKYRPYLVALCFVPDPA